jgi:hypothetical protein
MAECRSLRIGAVGIKERIPIAAEQSTTGICNNFGLLHNFRITFPDFYRFFCFPLYSRGSKEIPTSSVVDKVPTENSESQTQKRETKSLQNITRPQGIVKHYSSLGNGRKAIYSSLGRLCLI